MNVNTEAFENLPLPRKDFGQDMTNHYRVYKDARNYIVIKAGTALEALQSSGVGMAYKIERDAIDLNRVLAPDAWTKQPLPKEITTNSSVDNEAPVAAQPLQDASSPTATPVPSVQQATAEKPAQPLSNEDVDKLLKP